MLQYIIVFYAIINSWTLSQSTTEQVPEIHYQDCPEGLIDSGRLCYVVTAKSTFPPECPFENAMPFEYSKHIVTENKIGPVWMPVERDVSNRLGFLQWTEPGANYKKTFEENHFYDGRIEGKNCLVYYNSSYMKAVSCIEVHVGICSYEKIHHWDTYSNKCDEYEDCVELNVEEPKCICAASTLNIENYSTAKFLEVYANVVRNLSSEKECRAEIEILGQNRIFAKTDLQVRVEPVTDIFLSGTCEGMQRKFTYDFTEETIRVKWNGENALIVNVLNVYGFNQISTVSAIYCFTDANSTSMLYRYPKLETVLSGSGNQTYELPLLEYRSGHYWCEAFIYTRSKPIKSDVIYVEKNTFPQNYLATYRLEYPKGVNPLSPSILNVLAKFVNDRVWCLHQIVEIVKLDENKQQISFTVRFNCLEEFSPVYLNFTNIETMNIRGIDFCPTIVEENVVWKEAEWGTKIYSKEMCFRNTSRIKKMCDRDDFRGAHWTTFYSYCDVAKLSSVSDKLLEYSMSEQFDKLKNLLKNFTELGRHDVNIIANYVRYYDFQRNEILDLVDIVLNIDSSILMVSQTAEFWIKTVQEYALERDSSNDHIKRKNFAFLRSSYGVFVQKDETELQIYKLRYPIKPEDVTELENVHSAMWIETQDSELLRQLSFLFFRRQGFFFDTRPFVTKNVLNVFVVQRLAFFPVWIAHKADHDTYNKIIKCASWIHLEADSGAWILGGELFKLKSHFFCRFRNYHKLVDLEPDYTSLLREGRGLHEGGGPREGRDLLIRSFRSNYQYFGIIGLPAVQVTDALLEIFASKSSSKEILASLLQLTFRYDEFLSFDIFLTGKIFKNVHDNRNADLKILGEIINNLQKIDKKVLQDSQREYNATDIILHYTDAILKESPCEQQCLVKTDSFITLIYNRQDATFGGFVLLNNSEVAIRTDTVTPSELSKYKNFDSAVILSPELKNSTKFDETTKVIVSIFYNDALFNEKSSKIFPYNVVGKIYSVILPDALTTYSGPLSIVYKTEDPSQDQECSYWSYDTLQKQAGFWKYHTTGKALSSLLQCDFWHTTHFGVLILDKMYQEKSALKLTTAACSSLSLAGYFFLFLTACFCKSWRSNSANKLLLNFAFSSLFQTLVFYLSINLHKQYLTSRFFCVASGLVLHYSVLVQFCWMFVIAHFQYKKLILNNNDQTPHLLLKTNLMTWCLPLVIVISIVATYGDNYNNTVGGICYPSGTALYFGVWWPISLVIVNNFFIYIFIIDTVLNTKDRLRRHGSDDTFYHVIRLASLFFFFGLTWIFGFLAEVSHSVIFVYLFDTFATLQGFVLFLIYVVFNTDFKKIWLNTYKRSSRRHEEDILMRSH